MDGWVDNVRSLAGGYGDEEPLDYTVLSVGVMTLGLILFVEVSRHKLDHQAIGRPFFKAVLEATYSELATLGIVELFIFLLLRYYELKNKERKNVFAEVHFALFYTAIFNAFQSALCAFVTTRASNAMWVQTEHLELDHYVEIREEFDRVQEQYEQVSSSSRGHILRNFLHSLQHPGLRSRYLELLVQVRFHQLRLHFLEGNNLPLTLKVSDYLKRAEQKVLIQMVHVSGHAWLMLTGGFNVVYFLMGMVAAQTGSSETIGADLTGFFFAMLVLFIGICLALYLKMRSIFQAILQMKHVKRGSQAEEEAGARHQKDMFWFKEPKVVITLIQFMQFGYAIALATVLMYWSELDGAVKPYQFIAAVAICYGIFVSVLSKVLPQYTLCTSLGHLVDKQHLQETVAFHRLHEAQRRVKRKMVQLTFDTNSVVCLDESVVDDMHSVGGSSAIGSNPGRINSDSGHHSQHSNERSLDGSMIPAHSLDSARQEFDSIRAGLKDDSTILAKLVRSDTSSLRQHLPDHTKDRLLVRDRRRNRRKAISDGVEAMRIHSGSARPVVERSPTTLDSMAARANASTAHSMDNAVTTTLPLPPVGQAIAPTANETDDMAVLHRQLRANRLSERRQRRMKSVSASAVIQGWHNDLGKDTIKKIEAPAPPKALPSIDAIEETQRDLTSEAGAVRLDTVPSGFFDAKAPTEAVTIGEESRPIRTVEDSNVESTPHHGASPRVNSVSGDSDNDSVIAPKRHDDDSTVEAGTSIGESSQVASVTSVALQEFHTLRSAPWQENSKDKIAGRQLSPARMKKVLKDFFMSGNYPVVSNVFGSLVIFFLVGMRVEAMNAATGDYPASENTWELKLNAAFWWQATWYILFILSGCLQLFAIPISECKALPERKALVAAIMDIMLCVLCITLLFMAEHNRCCDDDDDDYDDQYQDNYTRFLAGGYDDYGNDTSYGSVLELPCCPEWGSRTHGGIGTIEPFTSLIGLRVARFAVSRLIVKRCWSGGLNGAEEEDKKVDHTLSHSVHNDHHGSLQDEMGTPLQLWERAISQYPHIAEKYGQFSGELFQAMLGLEIVEETEAPAKMVENPKEKSIASPKPLVVVDMKPILGKEENTKPPSKRPSHYKLTGDKYRKLPGECQGMILAGKLGKPVRSMPAKDGADNHYSSVAASTRKNLEFEIDGELLAHEVEDDSEFIAPNARLVRSMRRCDRRMLPLLKEWMPVDVVMTQFEIVYFEANVDCDTGSLDMEMRQKTETGRLTLQATRGGKGLRLCDVAVGRKVVGHLDLSEVTEVHITRDMPLVDLTHLEEMEELADMETEPKSEYWVKHSHKEERKYSRKLRWAKIKEDRLKVTSVHGTLVLRSYSDLNDTEAHFGDSMRENEKHGPLKMNIAFKWAQTIVHICGIEQLRQNLPHFGGETSDELHDYLEVTHYHGKKQRNLTRRRFRAVLGRSEHGIFAQR